MGVKITEDLRENIKLETAIIDIVLAAFKESRLKPIDLNNQVFGELIDGLGGNKTKTINHIASVLTWLKSEGYFTSQGKVGDVGFVTCVPTSKLIHVRIPRIEYSMAEVDLLD